MIDVCCLQEVRWCGEGSRMLGVEGMRYSCDGLEKQMELVVWVL